MAGPEDPEPFDPGMARERTSLAWTRTAISFAAAGAAIVKTHLVAGLIVLALGVITWSLRKLFPAVISDPAKPRRLLVVTVTVTAVAVVSLVVVLLAPASHGR
jgi:hypothetical protein